MPTSLRSADILFNDNSTMSTAAPGMIAFFAANTTPAGWLKANGATISRSVYSALFGVIGTLYGAGDGSTTFLLPDCRGYFPRSWDDGRGVDSGRAIGSLQSDAMRNLTGEVRGCITNTESKTFLSGSGVFTVGNQINRTAIWENWVYTAYSRAAFNAAGSTGVVTAGENRGRNVALLACIKF
jgi:microcystin-dependent protein